MQRWRHVNIVNCVPERQQVKQLQAALDQIDEKIAKKMKKLDLPKFVRVLTSEQMYEESELKKDLSQDRAPKYLCYISGDTDLEVEPENIGIKRPQLTVTSEGDSGIGSTATDTEYETQERPAPKPRKKILRKTRSKTKKTEKIENYSDTVHHLFFFIHVCKN